MADTTIECEIRGPFCKGTAVVTETPLACCDNCFAWVGYQRVRPVPKWKRYYKAICLFLAIVGRIGPHEKRMSIQLSWDVAKSVHNLGAKG